MSSQAAMSSRELYLRLLTHVKPYWRQFAGAILATVLLALTEPAIPALLEPLVDKVFVEKDPAYTAWTSIALITLFLMRGMTTFGSAVAYSWVSGKLVYDLRCLMFDRILSLPTSYFDANSTGNIVSMVTFNVTQVTTAATRVLTIAIKDSLSVIGLIGYMLWLNWVLTIAVFIFMPIVAIVVRLVATRLRKISRQLQNTMGDMTHALEEGVRGHKVIKVFGGQQAEEQRFKKITNWVRRYQVKIKVAGSANVPLVETVAATMLAILIYASTHETVAGQLTPGGFVAFLVAIGLLFPPIKRLTSINEPLQRGLAAAESVFELIDEPAEQEAGCQESDTVRGRLEFR